jgi:hypothetical protein
VRISACASLIESLDHLVGTVTGPFPVAASQGSSLSILTEPHDELPPLSFNHLVGAGEQRSRHFEAS